MAGLMAETTGLETAGAFQVPAGHDPVKPEPPPHSRATRRCGVNVTLSQQNQPSPPAAVPAESTKCSAKRRALEQGMDSESSSHLQTHTLEAHGDVALCPPSLTVFLKRMS